MPLGSGEIYTPQSSDLVFYVRLAIQDLSIIWAGIKHQCLCCFPVLTFLSSCYIFSSSLLHALFHDFLAGLDCPRILWAALDLKRLSSFPEPCFPSSRDVLKTFSFFWHTLYLSGRQRPLVCPGSWAGIGVKWKSLSHVQLFVTPWTIQSMEFSRPNTGVGSLSLLQGIFATQELNPGLPHCRQILYQLSYKGSPRIQGWVAYLFSSRSSRSKNRTRVSCIAGRFFTNWATRELGIVSIFFSFPVPFGE